MRSPSRTLRYPARQHVLRCSIVGSSHQRLLLFLVSCSSFAERLSFPLLQPTHCCAPPLLGILCWTDGSCTGFAPRFLQVDSTQQPDAGVQKGMAGFTWHDALICSCTWITRQPTVTAEECEIAVTRMFFPRTGGRWIISPYTGGGWRVLHQLAMDGEFINGRVVDGEFSIHQISGSVQEVFLNQICTQKVFLFARFLNFGRRRILH